LKIAVLGAGPAGSTFALWVKNLHPSWEVDIYEVRKQPKSICAGALGFHAIRRISGKILPETITKSKESTIYEINICLDDGEKYCAKITSDTDKELGIVVNRSKFDRTILKHAVDNMANYYPETFARPVNYSTIEYRMDNTWHRERYDLVVDARGADGYETWVSDMHILFQKYVLGVKDQNSIDIVFNFDKVKLGYFWRIPGNGYDKIGFGELHSRYIAMPSDVKKQLDKYLFDVFYGCEKEVISTMGATLPCTGRVKLVDKGVFKIGSAAGLVNPFTGAGIYYAIESAYNLAHSIEDSRYMTYLKYRAKEIVHINEIRVSKYLQKKLSKPSAMKKALMTINGVRVKPDKLYRLVLKYIPKIVF